MSGERDQAGHKMLVKRLKGCSKETDVGCYIRWGGRVNGWEGQQETTAWSLFELRLENGLLDDIREGRLSYTRTAGKSVGILHNIVLSGRNESESSESHCVQNQGEHVTVNP